MILNALKHLDFFESLNVEKTQEFVTIVEARKFNKGEHVIRKGEVGKYFYIIRTGNVSIQQEGLIGRKLLGTYEYFGEVALLSEVPRTADVVAETDVLLYA
jgi:CRP-like cAMP-binding protein